MVRFLLSWSLVLCACGGSSSPAPGPDAGGPAPRSFGAICAMASTTAADCDSHVCTDSIDKAGHPVCSQTCTMLKATDPSCPTGSMGQFCNMQGYCKP
jgi:hypothetical protein